MAHPTNPSFDVAHLGHVEVMTNKFEESLDFFTRVYGLKLSGQNENSSNFMRIGAILSVVRIWAGFRWTKVK